MKYKNLIMPAAALIILAAVILAITFCTGDGAKNRYSAALYFYNEQETAIEAENRTVRYVNRQELEEIIVKELIKGPENPKSHRVISPDAKLISVSGTDEGDVIVNFSKEFQTGDKKDDVLAIYSVVKSLCAVRDVYRVKVVADGADILSEDGSIIGFLTDQDINLSTDTYNSEMREVTLYFPSVEGGGLGKEIRSIRVTDQQPLAQYLINELIKGPQTEGLYASLSSETKTHSVEIMNGICFVNFTASFAEKNAGSAEQEKLTIASVVDSLTELENIDRVQLLIDGKRVNDFGSINIFGLFARDESVIAK